MSELALMYGLYLVYYVVLPLGVILLIREILVRKNYIRSLRSYGDERTEKNEETIEKNRAYLRKLQIFLVIFVLISLPALNFTFYSLQEITIDRERIYRGGFGQSVVRSPLQEKIGPSRDVDSVLEGMEESSRDWHVREIKDEIDFDELTKFPGRLTAYYLEKRHPIERQIVITYSYYSPSPITRVYGFEIFDDTAYLEEEKTIVYPLDPSQVDPF